MKLEYVAGRLMAITGTGFTSYAKSISSMKNYFINLQNKKHQVNS
jgi:hypothetical protein